MLTPITWTDLVLTAASPNANDLIKPVYDGDDTFNAAARSVETLASATEGTGVSFSFVLGNPTPNCAAVCGLTTTNPDTNYTSMEYAVRAVNNTEIRVYELGTLVYTGGGIGNEDVLSLVFTGGVVDYRLNGVSFFTSSATPTFPMFVKGSIRASATPSGISNVNIVTPSVPPADPTLLTGACSSGIGETILPGAPIAAFSADVYSGAAPLTVAFTDLSSDTPTSWLWEFGDGTTSTIQHPTHIFPAGTYAVRLTATNDYGSSSYDSTIIVTGAQVGGSLQSILGRIGYYVVDTDASQIKIYGVDGALLKTFGGPGTALGKYFMPTTCSIINGRQLLDRVTINQ